MSTMSDNTLLSLLEPCGLSGNEARVLAVLLTHGPNAAGTIAKRAAIKRPSTYLALESLVEAGFVTRKIRRGVWYFHPMPVDHITQSLRDRARHRLEILDDAARAIENLLKETPKKSQELGGFTVETFESSAAVYHQLESALNAGAGFYGIFDPQKALVGKAKTIVKRYLEKTAATKSHIRELLVPGPMADWYKQHIRNPNHKIRLLRSREQVLSDIIVLSDGILLAHYGSEEEDAIKIYHPSFHRTFSTLFERLWDSADANLNSSTDS